MSDRDRRKRPLNRRLEGEDGEELSPEVAEALQTEEGQGLSDEIARKWDPSSMLQLVSAQAGRGEALDETTRRRYETSLGADLGDVRIFNGRFAEEVTRAHSAEAFTVGGTGMIFMGDVASRSPETAAGRGLLAHELTHVAQETRGVQRRAFAGDTPNAYDPAEAEAEAVEQDEIAGAAGNRESDPDQGKKREALLEKLFEALVAHFEEEDRLCELRNGLPRFRT